MTTKAFTLSIGNEPCRRVVTRTYAEPKADAFAIEVDGCASRMRATSGQGPSPTMHYYLYFMDGETCRYFESAQGEVSRARLMPVRLVAAQGHETPKTRPALVRVPRAVAASPRFDAPATAGAAFVVADRPWVGDRYESGHRTLVLGESFYGSYPEAIATDHGYIGAWLAGALPCEIREILYPRLANALGIDRHHFFHAIVFTNFIITSVGPSREHKARGLHFVDAQPRLARLLARLQPARVWVLGTTQAAYSGEVIRAAGIPFEAVRHPASYGVSHAEVRASWSALQARPAAAAIRIE